MGMDQEKAKTSVNSEDQAAEVTLCGVDDICAGDIVLSNNTLADVMELMSWQEVYQSGQTWLLARRLISLASFIEAYVTNKRVLFAIAGDDKVVTNVQRSNFFNWDLGLVDLSFVWEKSEYERLIKQTDASIVYLSYHAYLKHLNDAKTEWEEFFRTTAELFKKEYPDAVVEYEKWDDMQSQAALSLAFYQAKLRELKIPFWANVVESSFCSPTTLTALASKSALRLVEEARYPHAEKNNTLVGQQVFDYQIPFVFGAVLRQASNWKDILIVAQQMRDTTEACAFRDWAVDLPMDLVNFHRHFRDVECLASDLSQCVDAREKVSIRMEYERTEDGEKPHIVFLQKLFEWNRSVASIDTELQRVFYPKNSKVALGKKMREWGKGCSVIVDPKTKNITLKGKKFPEESVEGGTTPPSKVEVTRYETHIYGPVYGSVHTGSGNISVHAEVSTDINQENSENKP